MKKAMLSQSMNGKTEEEIVTTREKAIQALTDRGYIRSLIPRLLMNGIARKK